MELTILYGIIIFLLLTICINMASIYLMRSGSKMDKERESQLADQKKKADQEKNDRTIRQIVNVITTPIVDNFLNQYRPKNLLKIQRKLYVAKWNKYFTPIQWIAFSIVLAIVGTILCALLWSSSNVFALIVFAFLAILPTFLLNNSYNNKTEELLLGFPETIRIIAGYLSAGMILPKAVIETAKSASPTWKPILMEFSAKCDTIGILDALDWFKNEVDIMEAREFFATVRLTIELGGSAKKGFSEQADKIQQLLRDAMQKRIEQRKVWATVVQAPIFLCIIAAFALPTVGNMVDMFSGM